MPLLTPTNRTNNLAPQIAACESSLAPSATDCSSVATDTIGVLLIGGDFQTLGVIRALHAETIPMYLLESESGIAKFSRHLARRTAKLDLLTASNSVNYLLDLADRENLHGWVIFCVNDDTVEFLSKNHKELSQKFVVPVPPWEISQNFFEKDRAYRLAAAAGMSVPAMYPSGSLDELTAADIRYPVVLKPTFKKNYYEKAKAKAILANNLDDLTREFQEMNQLIPASQIVVQEFIPGGTRNLYSFAALFDGQRVVSGLSAARLRQHPMDFGHATTFAESREMPELETLATQFLKSLDYRGVAEVEFMFDECTGEYKFIEMNGRFWGWHALTFAAGLNFPADLYRMSLGMEIQRKAARANVAWIRLITDVPTVLQELMRGRLSITKYLHGMMQSKGYAVWSWRDPMPSIAEIVMAPYLWWKKGF